MLIIQADDARAVALAAAIPGGELATAEYLLDRGADLNWAAHDGKTPLDVAQESGDDDLIQWMQARGARHARSDR